LRSRGTWETARIQIVKHIGDPVALQAPDIPSIPRLTGPPDPGRQPKMTLTQGTPIFRQRNFAHAVYGPSGSDLPRVKRTGNQF
jgi:hypothetical protein